MARTAFNIVDAPASAEQESDRHLWVRRVLLLAYLTIIYNLAEGVVAILFGVSEESVALFGFGVDSLIEVASAVLVLWRFRGEHALGDTLALERERRATFGIGLLFMLLAAGTVVGAVSRLVVGEPPDTALPGLIISSLSLSFMFFLWHAKSRAAAALDSATVKNDAACSMACIQLSSVLLAGSLVFWLVPSLWWADAAAALLLALLIGREGWNTVAAARKPDFDGGCGCGGGSCASDDAI